MSTVLTEKEIEELLAIISGEQKGPENAPSGGESTGRIYRYNFDCHAPLTVEAEHVLVFLFEKAIRRASARAASLGLCGSLKLISFDNINYNDLCTSYPANRSVIQKVSIAENHAGQPILPLSFKYCTIEYNKSLIMSVIKRQLGGCYTALAHLPYANSLPAAELRAFAPFSRLIADTIQSAFPPDRGMVLLDSEFYPVSESASLMEPAVMGALISLSAPPDVTGSCINIFIPADVLNPYLSILRPEYVTNYHMFESHRAPSCQDRRLDRLTVKLSLDWEAGSYAVSRLESLKAGGILHGSAKQPRAEASPFMVRANGMPLWRVSCPGLPAVPETAIITALMPPRPRGTYQSGGSFQSKGASMKGINNTKVPIEVTLGQTEKTLGELKKLDIGSIIQLDRLAGEPLDIRANNSIIAKGEAVVIDGSFGVRVTEVLNPDGQ